MDTILETDLLDAATTALADLGLRAKVTGRDALVRDGNRADGVLQIGYGDWEETRFVAVQRTVIPATLGAVRADLQLEELLLGEMPILVTEYVTPPLADRLKAMRLQFFDRAGNAYIKTRNALIWVRGRHKRTATRDTTPTGRAFEPSGLRVVFALLCDAGRVNENYRQLARDAGVAHGTVGWVINDLKARGFVVETRERNQRRHLVQRERLVPLWAEAYARALRPKLILARFRTDDLAKLIAAPELTPGALVGGEVAAARITHHLKPATATFWVDAVEPRFVIANKLVLDEKGPVELMKKFWTFATNAPDLAPDLVPDLLTYADLLAIGDARTLETAHLMQGQILDRLKRQT